MVSTSMISLLALCVTAAATCDVEGACDANAVPRQGRALLQVSSREAAAMQTAPSLATPVLDKYVADELLPQAEATRAALQLEVDSLQAEVDKCGVIMHNHSVDIEVETANLVAAEDKHHACDVVVQGAKDEKAKTCGEVQALLADAHEPASLESIKDKDPQAAAALLMKHYEYITVFYPKVVKAQEACKLATIAMNKTAGSCDSEMTTLAAAICALKAKLSGECAKYGECYAKKMPVYQSEVEKVMKLEEHNKNEFKYRTCFGIEKCDQATVDVSSLSIRYPKNPEKATCVQGVHTRFSYPGLECKAPVPVTTTAAAAETTPAPAAPEAEAEATTTAAAAEEVAEEATTTAAPAAGDEAAATEAPADAPAAAEAPAAAPAAAADPAAADPAAAADNSSTVGSLLARLTR